MAVPTVDSSALTCFSLGEWREIETALDSRSEGVEIGCIDRLASICHATPAPPLLVAIQKSGLPVFAGIVAQLHK
jgi:hypothetical protein